MGDDGALIEKYQVWRDERGFDWGYEFSRMPDDLARMLRALVPEAHPRLDARTVKELLQGIESGTVPRGVVLVRAVPDIATVRTGPPLNLPPHAQAPAAVLLLNERGSNLPVTWGTQHVVVESGRSAGLLRMLTCDDDPSLQIGDQMCALSDLLRHVDYGELRLNSTRPAVWSVRAEDGSHWFPPEVQPRWSPESRGWFVASECRLGLPLGIYEVTVGSSLDPRDRRVHAIEILSGSRTELVSSVKAVRRSVGPNETGAIWVDGDLHVHRNYSGTDVVDMAQAQDMQDAAQLDVMALVAGNVHTSHVYDNTLVGLPPARTPGGRLTLSGAEFRNDMYGHLVVLGATPQQMYSGHPDSDRPIDDVTPAAVASQARRAGGVAIVAHPFWGPLDGDLPWVDVDRVRSVEAAHLPTIAALGALDAVELLSPGHTATTESVVHRLFDCGFRFAVTAGSDTFMSFSSGPTSRPPGSVRCLIGLRAGAGEEAVLDAIRRGETAVANRISAAVQFTRGGREVRLGQRVSATGGPLTLDIEASASGDVRFELCSAGGRRWPLHLQGGRYRGHVPTDIATWVAVRATSASDPDAYFHATPVFLARVDVDAQDAAARWGLSWIERLRQRVRLAARGPASALEPVYNELAQAAAVYEAKRKGTL